MTQRRSSIWPKVIKISHIWSFPTWTSFWKDKTDPLWPYSCFTTVFECISKIFTLNKFSELLTAPVYYREGSHLIYWRLVGRSPSNSFTLSITFCGGIRFTWSLLILQIRFEGNEKSWRNPSKTVAQIASVQQTLWGRRALTGPNK